MEAAVPHCQNMVGSAMKFNIGDVSSFHQGARIRDILRNLGKIPKSVGMDE
jgi:hypothetical protein